MRLKRGGLLANHDFLQLWASESVSQVGAQVTVVALPLLAALSLDANAAEMGLLTAAGTAPPLLLGLVAGVWVDRLRRRPIMVATDLGRAAVLLLIPILWWLGLLRMELLYLITFVAGVQTLFFDVAWVTFLPSVVRRDQLVEGNSKLQATASGAQVAGPGLAGLLVGLAGAPVAVLVDAVSYLLSAFFILRVRTPEPRPERAADAHVLREIREGLGVVFRNPLLRAIAASGATVSLFGFMFLAVYVLFMTEELGFSATSVGLVFSLGGLGAVIGSMLAEPLKRRIGIGPAIIFGRIGFGLGGLLVPLAVLAPSFMVPLVLGAEFLQWLMYLIATINEVSLRQSITPHRLLGRVNATMRFLNSGMIPIGALAGGALGGLIGLRETLFVGVFGMLLTGIWVSLSPLRTTREEPSLLDEHGELLDTRTEEPTSLVVDASR
ncbi:MAG TPA: MFS transporter [Thermomicrobiales bacterium]|nr:MFS transporter [Thermomicrobiales bacterium]